MEMQNRTASEAQLVRGVARGRRSGWLISLSTVADGSGTHGNLQIPDFLGPIGGMITIDTIVSSA